MRASLICAVIALATPVLADERITDDTAYKTPEGHVRAGLWKLQYGVHGVRGLEVGTYTLPYLSFAADVTSANTQVKYQFFDRRVWTLSAGLGLAYVNLAGIGVDAKIAIVPLTILAAARLGKRFTLGLGMMYTSLAGEGGYNEDEATEFRGAVAVDNVQSWLSLTMKLSRGWSLYVESRGISSTHGAADGDLRHNLDERTTVDIMLTGKASIDEMKGGSTLLAFQYSAERFRMRFGAGYGNFNIPVVNFIIPVATPYPELDVYWVF
jgi:hypothetical protein